MTARGEDAHIRGFRRLAAGTSHRCSSRRAYAATSSAAPILGTKRNADVSVATSRTPRGGPELTFTYKPRLASGTFGGASHRRPSRLGPLRGITAGAVASVPPLAPVARLRPPGKHHPVTLSPWAGFSTATTPTCAVSGGSCACGHTATATAAPRVQHCYQPISRTAAGNPDRNRASPFDQLHGRRVTGTPGHRLENVAERGLGQRSPSVHGLRRVEQGICEGFR